ncbi:MAG: sensor histidine kinase, partial [Anaeroplasmataceae bacterium]
MKLKLFLKEYLFLIVLDLSSLLIIALVCFFFKFYFLIILLICLINVVFLFLILYKLYTSRKSFYHNLLNQSKNLNNKVLTEKLNEISHLDESVFYDLLTSYNKNMIHNLSNYKDVQNDYIEYIETWVHEIKLPLSGIRLMVENNNFDKKLLLEELDEIDKYIEQTLYYSKSNHKEPELFISDFSLLETVRNSIKRNSSKFISNKIKLALTEQDYTVTSDKKTVIFIISQIIQNAIKYSLQNGQIIINCFKNENDNVVLEIKDLGLGIKKEDISRI